MVNQKIAMMANRCSEPSKFNIATDNFFDDKWTIRAKCPHGHYTVQSNGMFDLETAFARLQIAFNNAHAKAVQADLAAV